MKQETRKSGNNGLAAKKGLQDGRSRGYTAGYDDGYKRGYEAGMLKYRESFSGTSIIIPNYNKVDFLRECIESIQTYTQEPYELIVVDNGSDDGSAAYLQSIAGEVKYLLNETNLGFAGAVNQGLNMAKGTTLLILNNDTVVTPRWLSNLLRCVNSDPGFGIVAPVTNYISGDQLISTNYDSIKAMQQFAEEYNRTDSSRWEETARITGFCMLLDREAFHRLGYFDEGFEIGNCEDDDYGYRARLLGLKLIIARDTFIHHYGSVSMKSLQSRFDEVYKHNLEFYSNKWEAAPPVPDSTMLGDEGRPLRMVDYYPSHVLVMDWKGTFYWIEHGIRYPLASSEGLEASRLASIDMWHWPIGPTISLEDCLERITSICIEPSRGTLIEGMLVRTTPDEHIYQYFGGKLHRIINATAMERWNLIGRPSFPIDPDVKNKYAEGLPVIPPIVLKAHNL